jgi:hypothetical protein
LQQLPHQLTERLARSAFAFELSSARVHVIKTDNLQDGQEVGITKDERLLFLIKNAAAKRKYTTP